MNGGRTGIGARPRLRHPRSQAPRLPALACSLAPSRNNVPAMSIFDPSPEPVTEVQAVREVRIGIAAHLREESVRFYADLLGLPIWPARRQLPGCIGLGHFRRGVLLETQHDPQIDDARRRATMIVPDLATLARRLEEMPWPYEWVRGFGFADSRIVLQDPSGHRIEVRQFQVL